MQSQKTVEKKILVLLVLSSALMSPVGCGHLSAWEGHTLSVHYSWNPNTQTHIIRIADVASGADVNDPQLSKEIAEEANRELPRWIQLQRLTRATGVFHARVLRNGVIEIVEAIHGVEGTTADFVRDPDVTPEMSAAHEGRLDRLKELIDAGGPVNAKDQRGNAALMAAVSSRRVELVQFLLEHGVDVNARNKDGDSALTLSVMSGQAKVARELADHGAVLDCNNPVDHVTFLAAKRASHSRKDRPPLSR